LTALPDKAKYTGGGNERLSETTPTMNFSDLLLMAIEETVVDLLSRRVLEALYLHLKKNFDIPRDEIPYRLETFFTLLEKNFGASTKTIGKAIARNLYMKLGLDFFDDPNKNLLDYVEEAKKRISAPSIEERSKRQL